MSQIINIHRKTIYFYTCLKDFTNKITTPTHIHLLKKELKLLIPYETIKPYDY